MIKFIKIIQVVDALKRKAIELYDIFLHKASQGYEADYQHILTLISFINMDIRLDNWEVIKQRLLNYGDTDYLHFGR